MVYNTLMAPMATMVTAGCAMWSSDKVRIEFVNAVTATIFNEENRYG